jgi:hypothetical protein
MKTFLTARWTAGVAAVAAVTTLMAQTNTPRLGFTGPEIYPVDRQISLLQAADINGDGRLDLVVANNDRSKINLLINQTGRTNLNPVAPAETKRELNELPSDARFRIESIASEKRIASMVVTDLNSDGRPDIVYYGEPKELVILYNQGTNGWSTPKRWPIDDGQLSQNSLAFGDLNGDGRTDLMLLGESCLYWFAQKSDHTFGEPERIPYSGLVKAIQILDIDGDGREDLLLINWDTANPFRFRLQSNTGRLGPEIHFSMPPVRSYLADDLLGDHKTEIMTIALNSGRAQLSAFTRKSAATNAVDFTRGQLQVMPLNKTSKAKRGLTFADLNGDRRPDLIVAEPDSGQITVFLQNPDGTLGPPQTFPSLTGISEFAVGDWDGNGRSELFLLSADERQIGVTYWDDHGRLPFPTILPCEGKPLAIALGRPQPDAKPTLAVIVDLDGKRRLELRTADGKIRTQKLSPDFKSNPSTMTWHDVDQDGLADLLVLIPFEKIKILRQVPDQDFEEIELAPPGGNADQPWLSLADVDGDGHPELLLAQKNFVRALVLQTEQRVSTASTNSTWAFRVKEQINGAAGNSRIVGAAALARRPGQTSTLCLLDAERKCLTYCDRDAAGVWHVTRNQTLPVTEFSSLQAVALGAEHPNSLAFVGLNTAAWMTFQGPTWEITDGDSYETPIKNGYLNDIISGHFNQDGAKDLVFLETARNYVDIVAFELPHRLRPVERWQVFEERTYAARRAELTPEPREALVADVTGDGKNDLILLVHDRILVYPQE